MAFRIYTKTGDKGTTALIGGTRVLKSDIRIESYGTTDELNSFVGMLGDHLEGDAEIIPWLREIQDRLFTIGSTLATDPGKDTKMALPDLHEEDIKWLEDKIDLMDEQLLPQRSFILPGGHVAASTAHVCRCVCRRAERICVHMENNGEYVPELVLKYLNRLSDFFFQLSRYIIQQKGREEIPWRARVQK